MSDVPSLASLGFGRKSRDSVDENTCFMSICMFHVVYRMRAVCPMSVHASVAIVSCSSVCWPISQESSTMARWSRAIFNCALWLNDAEWNICFAQLLTSVCDRILDRWVRMCSGLLARKPHTRTSGKKLAFNPTVRWWRLVANILRKNIEEKISHPVEDTVWESRHARRRYGLALALDTELYKSLKDPKPTAPSPEDKRVSKRQWERSMAEFRNAIKEASDD